jgi:predicted GNAT family N-acyltransferase
VCIIGGFFQDFQHGVGRLSVHGLRVIDDNHAAASLERSKPQVLAQRPHLVNLDEDTTWLDDNNVGVIARDRLLARSTHAARRLANRVCTVKGHGQCLSGCLSANAINACEEQGMGKPIVVKHSAQQANGTLLAYNGFKGHHI